MWFTGGQWDEASAEVDCAVVASMLVSAASALLVALATLSLAPLRFTHVRPKHSITAIPGRASVAARAGVSAAVVVVVGRHAGLRVDNVAGMAVVAVRVDCAVGAWVLVSVVVVPDVPVVGVGSTVLTFAGACPKHSVAVVPGMKVVISCTAAAVVVVVVVLGIELVLHPDAFAMLPTDGMAAKTEGAVGAADMTVLLFEYMYAELGNSGQHIELQAVRKSVWRSAGGLPQTVPSRSETCGPATRCRLFRIPLADWTAVGIFYSVCMEEPI